jgi:DNA adenine methylase
VKYLGGKYRSARKIAEALMPLAAGRRTYIEPFLGGAAVATLLAPEFRTVLLSDAHPDLIAMWQGLQNGWEPPDDVSEAEYQAARDAPVSALRGFIGFGCSFGGKWFGGYGRNFFQNGKPATEPNLAAGSKRSVLRTTAAISHAYISRRDYRSVPVTADCVIYADPPYANSATTYTGYDDFDHDRFWSVAQRWADLGALVAVSENHAPDGWVPLWHRELPIYLRGFDQIAGGRSETLFIPQQHLPKPTTEQTTESEPL